MSLWNYIVSNKIVSRLFFYLKEKKNFLKKNEGCPTNQISPYNNAQKQMCIIHAITHSPNNSFGKNRCGQ
jgi:hypothetical protein